MGSLTQLELTMRSLITVYILTFLVVLIGANNLFIVEVRDGVSGSTNFKNEPELAMMPGNEAETEQEEDEPTGYSAEGTHSKDPQKAMDPGDYADIFYDQK